METNLLGSLAPWGGFRREGREKQTDLFVFLTGGGGFETGGGGRLGGLPRGGGKAGDTFLSEKTGFNLSTETLTSLEPI